MGAKKEGSHFWDTKSLTSYYWTKMGEVGWVSLKISSTPFSEHMFQTYIAWAPQTLEHMVILYGFTETLFNYNSLT